MIGPVNNGRLEITAWDNATDAYTPDKAGRPLVRRKPSSHCLQCGAFDERREYKFNWSQVNEEETRRPTSSLAFSSTRTANTSSNGTYYGAGPWARTITSELISRLAALASPISVTWRVLRPFSALIRRTMITSCRSNTTGQHHRLSLTLLDRAGLTLRTNSADLDTDVPGLQQFGTLAGAGIIGVEDILGWEDYSGTSATGQRYGKSIRWHTTTRRQFPETSCQMPITTITVSWMPETRVVWRKNLNAHRNTWHGIRRRYFQRPARSPGR